MIYTKWSKDLVELNRLKNIKNSNIETQTWKDTVNRHNNNK